MGEQPVRGVLFHGELPRRVDGARGTGAGGAAAHGPRGTVLRQAAARSRKAVLRLQRVLGLPHVVAVPDRKSTRLNSSHTVISYAVFCLKKKKIKIKK